MHPAAAETGRLAGRVDPGQRGAVRGEDPGGQVRLQAAERFSGEDVEPDGDQRPGLGVEDAVRCGGPDQLVAQVGAGAPDRGDLEVLGEGVGDLAVAGGDLAAQVVLVDEPVAGEGVHAADQGAEVVLDDEVRPVVHERLHRSGHVRARPADHAPDGLAGQVGVLLGAGERELLADDLLVEHEPGVVVAGAHDVFEGAERVEAGEERDGQPLAPGVQPERGRAGQDADGVLGPDRVPVLDALGVVPHPVAVDVVGARLLRDAEHQPVHVGGHAAEHPVGRGAEPLRPLLAHELVVAADAAGGDDHRLGPQLEGAGCLSAARGPARRAARLQDLAADRVDGAPGAAETGDPVAEAEGDQALGDALADPALERGDDTGAGAPGDVEAGDGVAVAVRVVPAALGPADDGEEPHALLVQPGALLTGGEVDVRLGPLPRPVVLLTVEARRAQPVLEGQFVAVLDAHPALFG